MEMNILAEIMSKGDIKGVWCIASILWIFIVLILYAPNPIFGSCSCAGIFLFCAVFLGDSGAGGPGMQYTPNKVFITNASQTKFLERNKCNINHEDCWFSTPTSRGYGEDTLYIPANEMIIIDGRHGMKPDARLPEADDYYVYNETIDPINLAVEHGGDGVPTWLYHPASALYIFGLAGLPMIFAGGAAVGKAKG